MKTTLALLASIALLSGCIENGDDVTSDMKNICIDGVQYWVDSEGSNLQMMSPRIDPVTLTFVRCE